MKGLLIKDWQLLIQRRQTMIIFILVCLILGFTSDGSFIIGYMTFLSTIISMSTISYDDADNGMPFLMTLPISRSTYALSKYVLGGIFGVESWLLSIVMMLGIGFAKGLTPNIPESMIVAFSFLLMGVLILDLMIPLQLKYGAEKSRIVMFIVFGGIAAVIALLNRFGFVSVSELTAAADRIADIWYAIGAVLICVILTFISLAASIRIMKRKVF